MTQGRSALQRNAAVHFFAMHDYVIGGYDSQSHSVAARIEHYDVNVVVDPDSLSLPAGEN
jgi:hypothetical protein